MSCVVRWWDVLFGKGMHFSSKNARLLNSLCLILQKQSNTCKGTYNLSFVKYLLRAEVFGSWPGLNLLVSCRGLANESTNNIDILPLSGRHRPCLYKSITRAGTQPFDAAAEGRLQ